MRPLGSKGSVELHESTNGTDGIPHTVLGIPTYCLVDLDRVMRIHAMDRMISD